MLSLGTFDLSIIALGQNNSKNASSSSSTWLGSQYMLICNWARLSWCIIINSDCVVLFWRENKLSSFLNPLIVHKLCNLMWSF
jgi:hypothetical protein